MSDEDTGKIFDRLEKIGERLAKIETNQLAAKEMASDTAKKLDQIRTDGCVMGRDHDRRISNLESRPERFTAVVASIVAIGGALLAWLKPGR